MHHRFKLFVALCTLSTLSAIQHDDPWFEEEVVDDVNEQMYDQRRTTEVAGSGSITSSLAPAPTPIPKKDNDTYYTIIAISLAALAAAALYAVMPASKRSGNQRNKSVVREANVAARETQRTSTSRSPSPTFFGSVGGESTPASPSSMRAQELQDLVVKY